MTGLKRICGVFLLILAALFATLIPRHLHSTDPHQVSLLHADYFFIAVLGIPGILLLAPDRQPQQQQSQFAVPKPRKKASPMSLSIQAVALIAFTCVISFRSVVMLAGSQTVAGQVLAVDHPAVSSSGSATYQIDYIYRDFRNIQHTDRDTLHSTTPIMEGAPIEITYSRYQTGISRLAARVSKWVLLPIGLAVLYLFLALLLVLGREKESIQPTPP